MIAFAILLAGLGVADAVASGLTGDEVRRPWIAIAVGAVAIAAVTVGIASTPTARAGQREPAEYLAAALLAVAATAGWLLLRHGTDREHADGSQAGRRRAGQAIAVVLAGGVLSLWLGDLGTAPEEVAGLLVVVAGVALTTTGNALVRALLTVADPALAQPSERLRGGRLIGPLERLLIFGLVVTGAFTAATLVAAVKSLLRFPEVSQVRRGDGDSRPADHDRDDHDPDIGPDLVTEYFVVGSLASWTVAFGVGFVLA